MKPTYEELQTKLDQTKNELNQTRGELKRVREELAKTQSLLVIAMEEIADLKEKLKLNSKNSSKPPSSDQKKDTPPKSSKKRKKRKGVARSQIPQERVDKHIHCTQKNCPHCGSKSIKPRKTHPEILQQVELPEVQAIVTEYLMLKYSCSECGKNSTAKLPEGIPDSTFGPKLMALTATLTGVFHLAKREAIQLIKDLYNIDIGLGSVSNIEERVAKTLEPVCERIHDFVIKSKFCKHFDETGWRNSGKRHYVWVASCEHAAFYMVDRTRSTEAFKKILGNGSTHIPAVTDRYAVYNVLDDELHQYCLAHLIREFRRYKERDGPDREIGRVLEKEFSKSCKVHRKYREDKISWSQRNRQLGRCRRKVETWLEEGMANGSDKLSSLCENLLTNFDKLWTFMKIKGMEPTNNLGERDMRKLVVWRKKSYGTRSERGKNFVSTITTAAETLKRQGCNILDFIQRAIVSFYRGEEAPFVSKAMGF